ncbi:MAG TPA: MBL fold metallo-hydrolase, partial [Marmoricola sp.]|nr:MBL fold metallo-hydrolase [Marmoricola sp.]
MTTTLTFLGAAGTVTGSKYLLTVNERRILIDAGMFQGEKQWRRRNWEEFPVPPESITDVLLTHAHADHCAYLPALVKRGFSGPVWCTR